LNVSTTQQPQPPPQPFSLNQPLDLPSKYMFVPQPDTAQFHYRSDPRLALRVNCTCSLSSNLPTNISFRPTARKFDNCEDGISSPAYYIPVSTSPPETADEYHSVSSATNKSRPSVSKRTKSKTQSPSGRHKSRSSKTRSSGPSAQNSAQTTEFTDLTGPSSQQFQQPTHANMHQHGHQRLGNSYTENQTREFINGIRAFNPNFSFQCLLKSISVMLMQFMQHRYESALPIIFSTFFATLLGLPHNW
jgi:hypothetical protein